VKAVCPSPRPATGRRRALAVLGALPLAACARKLPRPPEMGPIAAMLLGATDDGGFVESGYRGLLRARDELGIPVTYVADVPAERERMLVELRRLAATDATLVLAFGEAASEAVQRAAWEFPEQRFVAIQGTLTRPNLAIYAVRAEQSAWLAGALAGIVTRGGAVGHVGGDRSDVAEHLRAGFAAGLKTLRPDARFLSTFTGEGNDPAAARRVALAQIDAGADVLFTTLGRGQAGASEACRDRAVRQIGSVRDWVAARPGEFFAAAVADAGFAVYMAARDLRDNLLKGDLVKRYGVHYPEAARLALAAEIEPETQSRLARYGERIAAGGIVVPAVYDGAEFVPA
jgi:basic membrane protein A